MAEEIFLRVGAARQLLVDKFGLHRLFFGQGAAELPHTRENLLHHHQQHGCVISQVQGLRRTEPHSGLLVDKTPWKKRTANYLPATLFLPLSWTFGTRYG